MKIKKENCLYGRIFAAEYNTKFGEVKVGFLDTDKIHTGHGMYVVMPCVVSKFNSAYIDKAKAAQEILDLAIKTGPDGLEKIQDGDIEKILEANLFPWAIPLSQTERDNARFVSFETIEREEWAGDIWMEIQNMREKYDNNDNTIFVRLRKIHPHEKVEKTLGLSVFLPGGKNFVILKSVWY